MDTDKLLSQKGLVYNPGNLDLINKIKSLKHTIKILYGETYDVYGDPIDSMKYYLFAANLADSLKKEGHDAESIILIADSAACRNESKNLHPKLMRLGEKRKKLVENINSVYKTDLKVVRMSEYLDSPEFKKIVSAVQDICRSNPEFESLLEKSVPESKIEIEKEKEFMYSIDEISSIFYFNLDIKIGPPREHLYDDLSRLLAQKLGKQELISVYLTPSYPVGVQFDYFIKHPEIEKYGVTAYKAGSKRMHENRIVIGRTGAEELEKLINNSFLPTNPRLPNPVLDMAIISEMAKQRITESSEQMMLYEDFYSGKIKPEELRKDTLSKVKTYILDRLN